ncbi:anibiotic ABC transporter efflux pump [Beutenbergia cavernae DSM 12333]|uniref:Anibiotic ABC transporter efflux pump n=1 Tax=Beutenbergia cavernae (strain ATCC BAA-8 / DSM 12333 / CCUG 43141 / JCM 11478 / NBRC 16432 / NCIMB 13614 / HKI 0122) TaxID=471853 RepID=C5BXC4_BEUC1|nr:antibiotic ABC transporter [Beutenbergia cavernae]ACQ78799.1 anibiotic ABC transporter efflux pump [Beutenbergia cavernae DSM 12333]
MSALTGTGTLVRLALRRERIRIPVWSLALGLTVLGSVPALEESFPTAEARQARAELVQNPAAIVMAGPGFGLDDYTLGAMVANELSLTLVVAAAIMSIFMVVRHTRAEEESGRAELVRAAVVGRSAAAVAALVTTAIANALVALLIWGGLVAGGLDAGDGLLLSVAVGLTGVAFGGVALVAAQVTEHARAASGMAMAVLGAAFLVRGIGDVLVEHGGLLSWFSPIAWAQQTRPYAGARWWPLLLTAALVAGTLLAAHALAARRDFAAGLVAQRPGRAQARPALASPLALATRLTLPSFVAWTVAVAVSGAAFGALVNSVQDAMEDSPLMEQLLGGESRVTESFFALFLPYLVLAAVAYALSVVQRLRSEETEGRAEVVLARPVSRWTWFGTTLGVSAVGGVLVLAVGAFAMGATGAAVTGDGSWTGRVTGGALAYVPALVLVVALGALLFGTWPKLFGLAWALVGWMTVVLVLGTLLDLPEWTTWISPVNQTPAVPMEALEALPLVIMGAGALVLGALGMAGFRRRDVPTV